LSNKAFFAARDVGLTTSATKITSFAVKKFHNLQNF